MSQPEEHSAPPGGNTAAGKAAAASAPRPANGSSESQHESEDGSPLQRPSQITTAKSTASGSSPFSQSAAQHESTVPTSPALHEAAVPSGGGAQGLPLDASGSMEDVWREIMATHQSTLDFSTYTPHGEPSSDEGDAGYSTDGSAGSLDNQLDDVRVHDDALLRGASSSSGGDRLASGRGTERRRDVAKRRVRRVGDEVRAAGREVRQKSRGVKQALRLTRSFTEYRTIAGESFIDARHLTKVANLGAGAFAYVEWAVLRRPNGEEMNVAVKRLRPDLISSDQDFADFVREGALLKRLLNPNIVEFVGLGFRTDQGPGDTVSAASMFIVQEFMNGGTLKLMVLEQMVAHHKVVYTFADALRWMTQLAEGLTYLHACRPLIIHRDLKLENCLLTEDEHGVINAKLADFGLHAIVDAAERSETVRKIKRLASSVINVAAASCAVSDLEPSQRLDSVLTVSGPSAARLSLAARDAALARSASAGLDEHQRPPRPRVVNRSASAAPHTGGMAPYRPSRLGRGSKETPTASSVVAPEPERAGPSGNGGATRDEARRKGSGSGGGNAGRRTGSSGSEGRHRSGRGGGGRTGSGGSELHHMSSGGSTDSDTAEARLFRAAGDRGSRIWQRVASRVHLRGREDLQPPAKHELTGQTGSFMYMAPEVMTSKSYNEKVDVFSLGIILFEVFAKSVTGAALLTTGDMDECEMYAWKVAHGYRRPIPTWWPPELGALVVACWAEDPDSRPAAAEVVRRLKSLKLSGAVAKMDKGSSAGCCCIQ